MATIKQIAAARNSAAPSKHVFSSKKLAFEKEDLEEFNDLLASYRQRFQPADRLEDDLVLEIAMNRFRIDQVWALRVSAFDLEAAKAYSLFESHCSRLYARALGNLRELQKDRERTPPTPVAGARLYAVRDRTSPSEDDIAA